MTGKFMVTLTCQCQSRNSRGLNLSIPRHSSWAADKAVFKKYFEKNSKKSPFKFINEKDLQSTQVPVYISFSRLRNPKKYQEVTLLKVLYFCEEFPHILSIEKN
jgi:hypothetical protein